jgi:hypothetical protein
MSCAAVVTAIGTLALFAVLGTLGQVVALIEAYAEQRRDPASDEH